MNKNTETVMHESVVPARSGRRELIRRRLWVVGLNGSLLAFFCFALMYGNAAFLDWLSGHSQAGLGLVVTLVMIPTVPLSIVIFFLAGFRLRKLTRKMADAPDPKLDERERSVRDRAHRLAYRFLGILFMLYFTLASGVFIQLPRLDPKQSVGVGFVALLLMGTLPMSIIAWTEQEL